MSDGSAPAVPAEAIETGAAPPSDVPSPVVPKIEDSSPEDGAPSAIVKDGAGSSAPGSAATPQPPAAESLPASAPKTSLKELASAAPLPTGSEPPTGSSQARKGANPAETVIRSFVESLARLARTHRDAVREAGGIAPLVTLLRSGTPEVQALAASVLRELASDNPANRDAILKAGGLHELVEMVHKDAATTEAGEAAGALRSLSNEFPAGCKAIIESRGVEALVKMVELGEPGSASAVQATGVLANLAQSHESNCEVILKAGGVRELVALLSRGHKVGDVAARRLPPETKLKLEKSAEEASNALWQLAAKAPSCNAAIRRANAIGPLIETLLRSGLGSSTAQFAAKAVVELVQADEAAKMSALDAIAAVASKESYEGHGWSLSFPLLRHLLQGAAERLLTKEEEGISTTGIQYAMDIGKAVELPQNRLDAAKLTWEEAQARQKREKLAVQAESRRKAKEEEEEIRAAQRKLKEEEAAKLAEAELEAGGGVGGGRARRKEGLPRLGGADGGRSDRRKGVGGGSAAEEVRARDAEKTKDAKSRLEARKGYKPPAPKGPVSERGGNDKGSESHRSGKSPRSSSKKGGVRNPLGSGRPASTDRGPRGGGGGAGRGSGGGGSEASGDSMLGDFVGGGGLAFIPRAQLLEKIERIAALNKAAPPIPANLELGDAPIDAVQSWHHRWDQKYHASIVSGFEQGFNGRGKGYNALSMGRTAPQQQQQQQQQPSAAISAAPAPAAHNPSFMRQSSSISDLDTSLVTTSMISDQQ